MIRAPQYQYRRERSYQVLILTSCGILSLVTCHDEHDAWYIYAYTRNRRRLRNKGKMERNAKEKKNEKKNMTKTKTYAHMYI